MMEPTAIAFRKSKKPIASSKEVAMRIAELNYFKCKPEEVFMSVQKQAVRAGVQQAREFSEFMPDKKCNPSTTTEDKMKYYVIGNSYVGPNRSENRDADNYIITSEPGRTNGSNAPLVSGWLGTTSDWDANAHGEFDTLDASRAKIRELTDGNCRLLDADDDAEYSADFVECWAASKYPVVDREICHNWCYDGLADDVLADTTDDEIEALYAEYERYANDDGFSLHYEDFFALAVERRSDKQDSQ